MAINSMRGLATADCNIGYQELLQHCHVVDEQQQQTDKYNGTSWAVVAQAEDGLR